MSTKKSSSTKQKPFSQLNAFKKLSQLAKKPIDLTQPNVLTPERIAAYCAKACGYKLLYATEKVNDEVMQALGELAEETQALEKMKAMQDGEIVNTIHHFPSENRAALHTATRDLFDHPNPSKPAKAAAAFARIEIEKLGTFLEKIDKDKKITDMIMIGIGGSDLGPRAHFYALQYLQKPKRTVHFITNVDPDDAAQTLRQVDLKKSLVVIVSKSGTTLETKVNEDWLRSQYVEAGLDPRKHFISITMPDTPMDNPLRYLATFHIGDYIGGRYSTTSMVGGVVLSFAFGIKVFLEFLKGAHDMDRTALDPSLKKNLPLLAALLGIWNHNFLNYATTALIPYSQALHRYPAHIQQVAMESNGKRIDKEGNPVDFETGSIIWGEPGTNAQHSFFQLIHQGTSIVPVSMVGFKESQYGDDFEEEGTTSQQKLLSNLIAQSIALATGQKSDNPNQIFPGNRPTNILLGQKLTPYALGALLAFFEHLVVFQGFIWNINAFDQEGVQLGKRLATKVMSLFVSRPKKKAESYPLGEAYLKHLENFS